MSNKAVNVSYKGNPIKRIKARFEILVSNPLIASVSHTMIRHKVKLGKSIDSLVNEMNEQECAPKFQDCFNNRQIAVS